MRTAARFIGALALLSAPVAAQCDLQTLYAANNGGAVGGAVYFDLTVTNAIIVTGLDTNTSVSGGGVGLTMYTIPGGRAGNMGSSAGWTQVAIDDGSSVGAGQNNPTPITFMTPAVITPGTYGVALVGSGTGGTMDHDYTNGGGGNQNYNNTFYALSAGNADNSPFAGGQFNPRVWNGEIKCMPGSGIFANFDATPTTGSSPLTVAFTDTTFTSDPGGVTNGVVPSPEEHVPIALEEIVSGFSSPTFLTAPPGDADRLFVVERDGLVRIARNGAVEPNPFLDISGSVLAGGERGLLGMVFHPQYATNGHFYVNYTVAGGDTQISRFTVSGDPDMADAASEASILTVVQPYSNHNGGMLAFGPDGMLYVGLGDGGSGGDPDGNGQDPSTLLGSMLRLDVDGGSPYAIPADNPFVAHQSYRAETWAYGLRNPWRYSFDRQTGDLYIADVGQGAVEEVSFQPAASPGGENYGWRITEGSRCYDPAVGCSRAGITLPVHEYGHSAGCSVTGGYVYRGTGSPSLAGRYFFGDFCSGWIRSFVIDGGAASDLQDHSADVAAVSQLASFGEDGAGELYVVSLGGTVYRIAGAE